MGLPLRIRRRICLWEQRARCWHGVCDWPSPRLSRATRPHPWSDLLGFNVGSVLVFIHGQVDEAEFAKNLQ